MIQATESVGVRVYEGTYLGDQKEESCNLPITKPRLHMQLASHSAHCYPIHSDILSLKVL